MNSSFLKPSEAFFSSIERLRSSKTSALSLSQRIDLCGQCVKGIVSVAQDWASDAARNKGEDGNPGVQAEDLLSGPGVIARQLQLTMQTLRQLEAGSEPKFPGKMTRTSSGQLEVPVFPTSGFYDSLTFFGLSAKVRMQQGVDAAEVHGNCISRCRQGEIFGQTAVLGAGNVSSIPALDSLNRIMFEGRRVVLKMNPINEYLAPHLSDAFSCLINADLLAIVTGDAEVGQHLLHHDDISDVHITGSAETHDRIVWGNGDQERKDRQQRNEPIINKPVTSELGNVTPWIIVPGVYSSRQLRSQAEHIAASITNNASFNCLATKVVVTWKDWPQRETFLNLVQSFLNQTPLRAAYYPGATERFQRFTNSTVTPDSDGCLPWTLLTDQDPDDNPILFEEESFVCVCAETQLEADSPADFLQHATDFVNARLTGTLCASITFPPGFRRSHAPVVDACIDKLRYGSVCINQWSGLAYGLISPPWGAYPGATIHDVQSGIGAVHNTYLLENFEKTILQGPLINLPKPIWFPSHKSGHDVAKRLLALYERPSITRLPALFLAALRG